MVYMYSTGGDPYAMYTESIFIHTQHKLTQCISSPMQNI